MNRSDLALLIQIVILVVVLLITVFGSRRYSGSHVVSGGQRWCAEEPFDI